MFSYHSKNVNNWNNFVEIFVISCYNISIWLSYEFCPENR